MRCASIQARPILLKLGFPLKLGRGGITSSMLARFLQELWHGQLQTLLAGLAALSSVLKFVSRLLDSVAGEKLNECTNTKKMNL